MKLRYSLIVFVFISLPTAYYAQSEGSAFTLTGLGAATPFARDYQTLGINPANLDIEPAYDRFGTIGLAESAFSMYSQVLTKPELRQNIFREDIKDFSQQQQKDYALEFAQSDNAFDIDVMTFGFAIRTENAGTFAFNTRERMDFYASMGPQVSELLWLGYNASYFDSLVVDIGNGVYDTIPNTSDIDPNTLNIIQGFTNLANAQTLSQLLQGTKLGFTWYREFNLGYGKLLYSTDRLQIHGGLGLKFLIGQGMIDIAAANNTATAFSALSPIFDIDYDDISANNPSAIDPNAPPLKPVGMGFGFDIGTTLVFDEKYILSAAINDIGSITWDGNLYELNDVALTDFENSGLESVDFVSQIQGINGSDGLLTWRGAESRVTQLPTSLRIGLGYDALGSFKVGADIVAPLSDDLTSIKSPAIAVGGEFSPMPWVHLQAGLTQGGNYGTKIPVGIYFTIGKGTYELGAASRDLVTFFRDNEPTVSMATGFLRFRF